jgi:molybdopterin converting factor small subunit
MKVKLRYAEYIRIEEVANGGELHVDDGTTVEELLSRLTMEEQYREFFYPIVEKKLKDRDYVLRDGDDVLLYLPAGGG